MTIFPSTQWAVLTAERFSNFYFNSSFTFVTNYFLPKIDFSVSCRDDRKIFKSQIDHKNVRTNEPKFSYDNFNTISPDAQIILALHIKVGWIMGKYNSTRRWKCSARSLPILVNLNYIRSQLNRWSTEKRWAFTH